MVAGEIRGSKQMEYNWGAGGGEGGKLEGGG